MTVKPYLVGDEAVDHGACHHPGADEAELGVIFFHDFKDGRCTFLLLLVLVLVKIFLAAFVYRPRTATKGDDVIGRMTSWEG